MKDAQTVHQWIRGNLGLDIPDQPVCLGHDAPFDYIRYAHIEPSADLVVWAPRGGGKTRLGAVATLLDLINKPGCAVRILGGSLEQSLRMWEHLLPDVEEFAPGLLASRTGMARRVRLTSGSTAAVLTQSQRAVRGLRVQKLRCDEVELFDPLIWEAAQLITRSVEHPDLATSLVTCSGGDERVASDAAKWDGSDRPGFVRGSIEAISTHHLSHGLMHRILKQARKDRTRIIRWCLLEVLEHCPDERKCDTCPLWDDCRGVAKTRCNGFVRIDDAIAMKRRVSQETWECEMLCRRPSTAGSVFPAFEPTVHVRGDVRMDHVEMSLALDFGFNAPFVCLWVADDGRVVHVIDEYVQPGRTVADHIEVVESRGRGIVKRICCDPAGAARNEQTAESNVQYLRRRGYRVQTKRSLIVEGVELIRTALRPADGQITLFIHPRCANLIEAMREYRYPPGGGELPLKDGVHDHPIDALRYFYVNRSRGAVTASGRAY